LGVAERAPGTKGGGGVKIKGIHKNKKVGPGLAKKRSKRK
jgi:hypothetical protein